MRSEEGGVTACERNINMLTRMRDARLRKLAQVKPFIAGTVVEYQAVCANERCKCARGQKHPLAHLTRKDENQKTVAVYIPVDKREEVAEWAEEYRRLKRLISEISELQEQILRRHVTEKRLKRGRP